jgi:hypothetical protein
VTTPNLMTPGLPWDQYDGVEVAPLMVVGFENGDQEFVEICPIADAQFWSVYLHLADPLTHGAVESIADVPTREQAMGAARMLLDRVREAGSLSHPRILLNAIYDTIEEVD